MMNLSNSLKILILIHGIVLSTAVIAAENLSTSGNPPVYVSEINPERDVGYYVGDILQRTLTLRVEKPYQLLETSLPLVGNEKKYRGQKQGIEIHSARMKKSEQADFNIYTLDLSYQIFTSNVVAKPSALPAEYVKFGGNGRVFAVRLPSWNFRISPLAVFGSVKLEQDMSQFRGPLLLDSQPHRQALWALLATLGVALAGLLYILGNRAWLPRMGGPFARASRDLRKLPATDRGLQQALMRVHQAFNTSHGSSVFATQEFLAAKPGFVPLREEIERFFLLSRAVFFDESAQTGIDGTPLSWLRQFCRRCRDCERGLK